MVFAKTSKSAGRLSDEVRNRKGIFMHCRPEKWKKKKILWKIIY